MKRSNIQRKPTLRNGTQNKSILIKPGSLLINHIHQYIIRDLREALFVVDHHKRFLVIRETLFVCVRTVGKSWKRNGF